MKVNAGKIIGAVMLAGGVAAIWLWPKNKAENALDDVVRPVRSMVVSDRVKMPELRFPGIVKAGTSRDLVFEVGGRLLDINTGKGQRVKKDDVLARLDARDFEADVKKAEAAYERTKLTFQRMGSAEKIGGVSKEDVSKAEADAKTAEAQLAIAKKALESCVIKAPFDGLVADTYPSSLDMITPGQKVLTLQSTDQVKFDISIPETMIISQRFADMLKGRRYFVVFDSLAGKEFDVKFDEFTAQADEKTQTFTATFSMPSQEGFIILPGMSVTLVIEGGDKKLENKGEKDEEMPLTVPTVAVGADEAGAHFVWKLEKTEKEGEYKTVRQRVETGRLFGTNLAITSGLANGDRIAVAGVSILTEGRIVTLWKE